jgi:hypothetical protein
MPGASTADLVLAGITDIQQAILRPAPGLHLPPADVSTLKQLTEVLTSVIMTDNEHTPIPKTVTSLRMDSLHTIASSIDVEVPPLRVVAPLSSYQGVPLSHQRSTLLLPHQKRCSLSTTEAQAFMGHNNAVTH